MTVRSCCTVWRICAAGKAAAEGFRESIMLPASIMGALLRGSRPRTKLDPSARPPPSPSPYLDGLARTRSAPLRRPPSGVASRRSDRRCGPLHYSHAHSSIPSRPLSDLDIGRFLGSRTDCGSFAGVIGRDRLIPAAVRAHPSARRSAPTACSQRQAGKPRSQFKLCLVRSYKNDSEIGDPVLIRVPCAISGLRTVRKRCSVRTDQNREDGKQ